MQQLNIRSHLARNLKALRKEARLTQKTFSARLSNELSSPMDPGALSRRERGDRAINVDELLLFAAVLDVPPAQLLMPRPGNGDLQLSGTLTIPAPRARDWIQGRKPLREFDGVPADELTLPEDELHDEARQLQTEIALLEREIRVRQTLLEEARNVVAELMKKPELWEEYASIRPTGPFEDWIEAIESTTKKCRDDLLRLKGRETELSQPIKDNADLSGEDPTQPQADASEEA